MYTRFSEQSKEVYFYHKARKQMCHLLLISRTLSSNFKVISLYLIGNDSGHGAKVPASTFNKQERYFCLSYAIL